MDDSIRTGEQRLPPGQHLSRKWPVLTYGRAPSLDIENFRLRVFGRVGRETTWSWSELQALPRIEVEADFHCVTRFSTLDNRWAGFSTRTVLDAAEVDPEAAFVHVHCLGGYTTNLPLEDFLSERALFADRHSGESLASDHGGPLRLVVPHLYAWKSAKWVEGIELLEVDRRGFWEENGYHSYGDPWREERFSSQETEHAYEVRRRAGDLGLTLPEEPPAGSS